MSSVEQECNNTVVHNGTLRTDSRDIFTDFETRSGVYDVVRVLSGVPLFLEEHLARLRRSARLTGFEIDRKDETISLSIDTLIRHCGEGPYSIKIIFSTPGSEEGSYCVAIVPRHTPSPDTYETGVATTLVHLSRLHPQIKANDRTYNERVSHEVEEYHVFEILLVDEHGRITEGGKSNIFFVVGESLVTPPKNEVLPGITREKIRSIAEQSGIPFVEKDIPWDAVGQYEAAFLTGTSIFVLPVSRIEHAIFRSAGHPLVRTIAQGYRELTDAYIRNARQ